MAEEIIKDICTDTDHEEITRAKKLVDKKLRTMGNYSAEEVKKKLWRFLLRKGYSFDTIMQILKQFKIKEEEA
ncbi:MAG: RecX family transcriptional regulator [Nitrospirota bacterium]